MLEWRLLMEGFPSPERTRNRSMLQFRKVAYCHWREILGQHLQKLEKMGSRNLIKKFHGIAQPFLNKIFDSFTNLKENMIAQQEGCSKVMSILCKPASRKAKVCENS